jgi:hypothetical protein
MSILQSSCPVETPNQAMQPAADRFEKDEGLTMKDEVKAELAFVSGG